MHLESGRRAGLSGWSLLRRAGRTGAAVENGPAVAPIDRIHERGALGEAHGSSEVRIVDVDGVVDRPPLTGVVHEDGVVAGPDPAVSVLGDDRGAAGPTVGRIACILVVVEGHALTVDE